VAGEYFAPVFTSILFGSRQVQDQNAECVLGPNSQGKPAHLGWMIALKYSHEIVDDGLHGFFVEKTG
jgi:hypothetical protein